MRDCQTNDGTWRDDVRSSRACGLAGIPPVRPKPTAQALYQVQIGSAYRGRYPDRSLIGTVYLGVPIDERNWEKPIEDPADGCPRAWYGNAFIDSIDKYSRRRTEDGGRVPNPRFDQADWLIQDAIRELEDQEERFESYVLKVSMDRQEVQRTAQAAKAAAPPRPRPAGRRRG